VLHAVGRKDSQGLAVVLLIRHQKSKAKKSCGMSKLRFCRAEQSEDVVEKQALLRFASKAKKCFVGLALQTYEKSKAKNLPESARRAWRNSITARDWRRASQLCGSGKQEANDRRPKRLPQPAVLALDTVLEWRASAQPRPCALTVAKGNSRTQRFAPGGAAEFSEGGLDRGKIRV
jgi:hypothetical protein